MKVWYDGVVLKVQTYGKDDNLPEFSKIGFGAIISPKYKWVTGWDGVISLCKMFTYDACLFSKAIKYSSKCSMTFSKKILAINKSFVRPILDYADISDKQFSESFQRKQCVMIRRCLSLVE